MKSLSTSLIVIALLGTSVLPTFADEDDEKTHGRWDFAIEAELRDRGVIVSGVEEWGGLIRAWIPNENGGTSMMFIDPDTLMPVSALLN